MHSYKMGETWLGISTSEKDLGIAVDQKLNMYESTVQCGYRKDKCYFRLH